MSKLHLRLLLRKAWMLPLLTLGVTVSLQTGFGAGSMSTDPVSVTPTWHPQLHGEQVGFDGTRWGFGPVGGDTDSPPTRYLTRTEQWWLPNGSWTTHITRIDQKTGQPATTIIAEDRLSIEYLSNLYDNIEGYEGDWNTFINLFFDPGTFWMGWGNDNAGDVYKFSELSDPYTPETFVGNVPGWVSDFQNAFTRDVNSAYLHFPADKLTCNLYKLQYKWNVGGQTGTVIWDEQFTPDDDGVPVQHHIMTWTGSGESPVFSIAPANYPTVHKNGTYEVIQLPVELVVAVPTTSGAPASPGLADYELVLSEGANLISKAKLKSEGAWAVLNFDDDDNDGGSWGNGQNNIQPDFEDMNGVAGENDLLRLGIKVVPLADVHYRLQFDNTHIRLWTQSTKGDSSKAIVSEQTELLIPVNSPGKVVFIEGIKPPDNDTGTVITEQIKIGNDGQWIDGDTVKVRVAIPILTFFGDLAVWQADINQVFSYLTPLAGKDPTRNRAMLPKAPVRGPVKTDQETYLVPGKTPTGANVCYSVSIIRDLLGSKWAKIALALEGVHIAMTGHSHHGIGLAFGENFEQYSEFFTMAGAPPPVGGSPYMGEPAVGFEPLSHQPALSPWTNQLGWRVPAIDKRNAAYRPHPVNRFVVGAPLQGVVRYMNKEKIMPPAAFPELLHPADIRAGVTRDIRWNFHSSPDVDDDAIGFDKRTALRLRDDVPATLKYKSLLLNMCNSYRQFIESFEHGDVFSSWQEVASHELAKDYVQAIIEGWSWADLLIQLKSDEPPAPNKPRPRGSFEYTSFNSPP